MNDTPDTCPESPKKGLSPIHGESVKVLILGSFPSRQSLMKNEYYGNVRNHFWQIIETLFDIDFHLPYEVRTFQLARRGIALWDVICACERPGSADSRIRNTIPNDIAGFVREHQTIRLVALNGSMAGRFYHQFAEVPGLPSITFPSTSPANTRFTLKEKVRIWEIIRSHSIQ